MNPSPGRYDFPAMKAGAQFAFAIDVEDENEDPVDLTGYTALMHVRYGYKSAASLLELKTQDGSITLGGSPFNVLMSGVLPNNAGNFVYDCVLIDPAGKHWPVLTGRFPVEASTV